MCSLSQVQSLVTSFDIGQVELLCQNLLSQTATASVVANLETSVTGLTEGLNVTYLFLTAALVFVMHGGFAMVRYLNDIFNLNDRDFNFSASALRWGN
jgi:hypothetical protein